MMELRLELPWPPSVNNYKKIGRTVMTKNGKIYQHRYNSNATKTFYYEVYIIVKQSMPSEWVKFAYSKEIEYEVDIHQHPPSDRKMDSDNFIKVLFDSLVRAKVIYDDSQITGQSIKKMVKITKGKVIIRLIAKKKDING